MKDEAKTKEQLIEDLAALRDRCTEEAIEHYDDIGPAVNALLRLSLEDYSLKELLQKALDIILSVSSLSIETKGNIFLVEDEPEVLVMKAEKGLAEPLLKECARIPFGKCLCGRAASTKRIEFADHIDERHEINFEGITPHGHYCVPILLSGNTTGVINLYLKDGHSRIGKEEEFLDSVANTLAGIIKRKRAEEKLRESEGKYRGILESMDDAYYELDLNGNLVFFNEALISKTGYSRGELMGMNYRQYISPETCKPVSMVFSEIYRTGQPVRLFDYEVIMKGGQIRNYESWANLLFDNNNQSIGFRGMARDITTRKRAEERLKETLESLRKAFGATIQVMVSAVEIRDPYTAGHQLRSADLARAIATEMGLPQEKIDGIRMAGSIHDIGKLSIPAEILSKPTKLSEIEFSFIKEHSKQGYEMLKGVESPWPLAEIVYQHHERMDGSGYPRNLKGEEILMEARVLAVSDVIEAMASHRPYRPGLGIDVALNEIEKNRGIFYDNAVVDACLRLFREKGFQFAKT
jgi:PAS domain S-box-containing protein